jgi:hypothetical protein
MKLACDEALAPILAVMTLPSPNPDRYGCSHRGPDAGAFQSDSCVLRYPGRALSREHCPRVERLFQRSGLSFADTINGARSVAGVNVVAVYASGYDRCGETGKERCVRATVGG